MATILVKPLTFAISSSQSGSNTPASNLNVDYPNMVWRSTSATGAYVVVDLGAGASWDFVALVGSKLFAADSVRIRAAGSAANTASSPSYDVTMSVTGTADQYRNLVYHLVPATKTLRYVRLDFTLSGNPNAFVEAQRLVIGKRLQADGIDIGADFNFEDSSRVNDYRGIQITDAFDVKQSWKYSVSNIKIDDFNVNWRSFLKSVSGKAVLFIPDTENGGHNQESTFGRIQPQTNANLVASDQYKVNLYIREV